MADLDEHRRRMGRDRYLVSWRQMLRSASVIARSSAQRLIANIARYGEDSVWQVDLTHVFPQLLELLPVWAVTNQSARGTLPLVPGLFDVLIIDEASQSDIASIVPLLFRAKQAAFLGDPKQLTHVTCLDERHIRRIADDWLLTESQRKSWNFVAANAYELACQHIDDRPVLLNQHYRSHPSIIEFCNRSFYDSQLVVCTDPGLWAGTQGIRWVNVTGQMHRTKHGSWYNREEVESVVDLVRTLLQPEDDPRPSIGIVSPYRAQVELIRSVLSQQNISDSDIKVATAHRFQGDERDIMVYSSVVSGSRCKKNNLMAFQPELVNVAVSRARRRLYIVGDFSFLQASQSVLGDLARFYEELETHGALSPFELRMRNLLAEKGIRCELGATVAGIRVAIAVQSQSLRLDVECDGHAFRIENSRMRDRDMILRQQGWRVIRFSPRTIARSPEMCVRTVLAEFERTNSAPSR